MTAALNPSVELADELALSIPHSLCNRCGQPVIVTAGDHDGLRKVIDPTPVAGGLYSIQGVYVDGLARKRNPVLVYREVRAGLACHGGGLNPHPRH